MVVDERSRHELYRRLEEVLGADAATTLIEHLPPVGWADVATKHDLAQLEEVMDIRFVRILDRFTALDTRLDDRFTALDTRLDDRFARVDDRFARVDDKFVASENRFDDRFTAFEVRVDDRFTAFEERIDGRFAQVDDRAAAFEERIDSRLARVDDRFGRADDRAAAFEERVDGRFTAFENRFELHEHVVREALLGLEVTVEHGLRSQMNTLVFALVGTVLTMAGLAFALARFPT